MVWAPDCLASHACVPGSNHTVPVWGFQSKATTPYTRDAWSVMRESRWCSPKSLKIERATPDARDAWCVMRIRFVLAYSPLWERSTSITRAFHDVILWIITGITGQLVPMSTRTHVNSYPCQLVPMSTRTTNRCQLVPQVMSTRTTIRCQLWWYELTSTTTQ